MSFLKSSNKKVRLLLDVGSGSLTVSLVLFEDKKVPVFLHTISQDFVIVEKLNSVKLFENMIKSLDLVLTKIMKDGFNHKYWKSNSKKLDGVTLSFSSPWFMPKTKHIEIVKEKAFVISESFVDEVISKEEKIFESEIINSNGQEDSFEVIEKTIVHIKVNGYILNQTFGHRTNTFDAYLCMSIVSSGVIHKINELILKHTHIPKEKITAHTFPVVSFAVLRDLYQNHSNFLIIDTTSEVTDVTLVQNEIITETASFPSGRNFVIRQIVKGFGVSSEIAESTFSLYTLGKLDTETNKKMEAVLVGVEKEWSIYFQKAISEVAKEGTLPNRIYLTCDSDVANLYTSFLKLPKADETATLRKNVDIVHLNNTILAQLYKNDSVTVPNEFIVTLAVFCNKIFNK